MAHTVTSGCGSLKIVGDKSCIDLLKILGLKKKSRKNEIIVCKAKLHTYFIKCFVILLFIAKLSYSLLFVL